LNKGVLGERTQKVTDISRSGKMVILAQRTEKVKQMKIVSVRASRKEEAAPH
jgi:hypothetical protein